jgi:CheY-like chemotaxis protein
MDERERVNILLVDDDPAQLLSYEAILSELGENLITASSGREALTYLLQNEIAVILLDVHMPEIDGFELSRLIREHPRYQETAMIFISAVFLTPHDQLRGYEHGAVDYITVPFIPELLRAKVRVFVEHYRCRQELAQAQREVQRAQHRAVLGRLAAGVSHEIRNPLGVLALHIDILEEELRDRAPESVAQVAGVLAEMKTQMARLDDLLQDYLSLVRVSTIELTPHELGDALQAWAGEWQQLALAQGGFLGKVVSVSLGHFRCGIANRRRVVWCSSCRTRLRFQCAVRSVHRYGVRSCIGSSGSSARIPRHSASCRVSECSRI